MRYCHRPFEYADRDRAGATNDTFLLLNNGIKVVSCHISKIGGHGQISNGGLPLRLGNA